MTVCISAKNITLFRFKSMGVYLTNENVYAIDLNNCDCKFVPDLED